MKRGFLARLIPGTWLPLLTVLLVCANGTTGPTQDLWYSAALLWAVFAYISERNAEFRQQREIDSLHEQLILAEFRR